MYTSHSLRLGVLPFWFVGRVAVGASPIPNIVGQKMLGVVG